MGFEENIRRVVPYVPGEQPKDKNLIKLNTNENPYPPSPRTAEAIRQFDPGLNRLYPDPAAGKLIRAIAGRYGLEDSEVFAGVGSDDVLAMCFLTFFNGGKPVLFPDITYSFYDVWAELFRIPYEQVPLDDHFRIRPEDYDRACGGIVIANPNAPTGELLPVEEIERIVGAHPECVVIVDEAYIDFGGESALPLIRKYKNLIVVQTFSKSRNLAGMRIGYAMADASLIRWLNDVKYSFNSYTMSRLAIEAGAACIRDEAYFAECCRRIMETREKSADMLRVLGFRLTDSASNFLFATHPDVQAKDIFDYLRGRGIYVRWWDKPRIRNYLRITVGTDREMEVLGEALAEFLRRIATALR
ncbi:MAG: histidinol-phosphate transaminase [Lachnospiraceae bacterium]|nr:histidinol-phosphate transaminase [Lachnospiraceae bacterium]